MFLTTAIMKEKSVLFHKSEDESNWCLRWSAENDTIIVEKCQFATLHCSKQVNCPPGSFYNYDKSACIFTQIGSSDNQLEQCEDHGAYSLTIKNENEYNHMSKMLKIDDMWQNLNIILGITYDSSISKIPIWYSGHLQSSEVVADLSSFVSELKMDKKTNIGSLLRYSYNIVDK